MDVLTVGAGLDLELDEGQADLLRDVLDQACRDLRSEIVGTDRSEYKRHLRERETALRTIRDLAREPLPAPR